MLQPVNNFQSKPLILIADDDQMGFDVILLLKENLSINCIHENVVSMDATHYEDFLLERRKLMAKKN